ncbi:MAG: DUF937 domain-containing protein, partial [Polyangiales bacterium]
LVSVPHSAHHRYLAREGQNMDDLMQSIVAQLSGAPMAQLSSQLGTDSRTTQNAVQAALPLLLGALAKNSAASGGADALASALDRDHDGGILDDIGGFLAGGASSDGAAILGHILGKREPTVEAGIGKATGMQTDQTAQLLQMLAPIVLGYLGRQKQQQGMNAGTLGELLGTQSKQAQSQNPALSALASLLDKDDDGSIVDDLGGMLGSFLSGR